MKGDVYDFSKGFAMFITYKDVTGRDIKIDENKIKQFLRDIGYKQRGDTESNRSNFIGRTLASIWEPISQIEQSIVFPSREDNIYRRDTSDYEQSAVEEEEED